MITTAQRAQIALALGRDTLRIAERINAALEQDGSAPGYLWRELLENLYQSPDLMESPLGQLFTYAVLGRMNNGNDDASERRPKPGGGFPMRPV